MAIGQGVFILIRWDLGPLAVLPLHVAGGGLVAADLAHVMQQRHQGDGLLAVLQPIQVRDPLAGQVVRQAVVDVQAVLTQAAGVSPVVPGGRRSGEKVAFVGQVIQQGLCPVPVDVLLKQFDKFFLGRHGCKTSSDGWAAVCRARILYFSTIQGDFHGFLPLPRKKGTWHKSGQGEAVFSFHFSQARHSKGRGHDAPGLFLQHKANSLRTLSNGLFVK